MKSIRRDVELLLDRYDKGRISKDRFLHAISSMVAEPIGFATIDHHRELRQGFPEVILCEGKTPEQVGEIARRIVRQGSPLLGTRAAPEHFLAVRKKIRSARFNRVARTITANEHLVAAQGAGSILVVTAGTSDIPVAEEALETLRMMGNQAEMVTDVGVAGIHRLFSHREQLRNSAVIIVVAGMEGALASVIGGLVDIPVIAVPTSIGYGANFGGISALLGMLTSCAAGVTVVNIDNGFGAGVAASLINRRRAVKERPNDGH
jgi:NCAIR mutase (PurE)-related protein